jgi:tRNA modification GTPase
MSIESTIIAPASALGGGVAVIRASGPLSGRIFDALTGRKLPSPRQAQLVRLTHPATGKTLDSALALYFQNPESFTGEDVLELHVHGGCAVVDSVIRAALSVDPSIRLAEAGEFSKRAYLNGKIDLIEAEAIADLVAAETEAQAELAVAQMGGALGNLYEDWRAQLVHLLAMLEAEIDFVDEEDVPQSVIDNTRAKIAELMMDIDAHLGDNNLGERLRDGFVVAVIGAPNAGKSSLVNTLAKRDVAIVTPIAGTTRDVLEVPLNIGGYPVIVMDTAGLRETEDTIEKMGIERAKDRAKNADIIVALFDATHAQDNETLDQIDAETIVVYTKSDLQTLNDETPAFAGDTVFISTTTGKNIDILIEKIAQKIAQKTTRKNPSMPLLTRARHREAVNETQQHLQRAFQNPQPELLAEDIRLATRALGRITGRVDVEDLLDIIFSQFCIGK